ncbi:MAG: cell division protein FtsQ/DivIB [Pseudomonadota bacterium]|nr:cell division protein FtsQ/DivIB [Pseudomonadota bacterium]
MRRLIDRFRKSPSTKPRLRRRSPPGRLRPAMVYGAVALTVAGIAGGTAWSCQSGYAAGQLAALRIAVIDASGAAGMVVEEVYVAGRVETARDDLIDAVGVTLGTPLMAYDADAARLRIEALGWVLAASIERRFPDTVFVRIAERRALALWQRDGRLVVVDRDGVVIDGARPENFARLPVIVGDDAPEHAARLLAVLAVEPGLSDRIEAAVRVGGRRWNLRFDNGVDVAMPETGLAEAWRRLAAFERRHQLLGRDITAIDLRLPDRVVVRPSGVVDALGIGGENT